MIEVEEDLIIYALRYALGRQTYCVPDVISTIKNNLDALSNRARCVIARDIGEFIIKDHDETIADWAQCFKHVVSSMDDNCKAWLYDVCAGRLDEFRISKVLKEKAE